MAKVTPILWKHKTNKQGQSPIYLRLADTDKTRYVSLRAYVLPSQWNGRAGRVRKSHPQHRAINNLIAQRMAETQAEILRRSTDHAPVTATALKESLQPEQHGGAGYDFFAYADEYAKEFEARGKISTYRSYKSSVKKFRAFAGAPLPFEAITPKLLRAYETHLMKHHGNNANTIAKNFDRLRSILYRAIKEGLADQAANPFFQFSPGKRVQTERGKLSLGELREIEVLDLKVGTLIWHTRHYFLFSFYCAGIRFGDLAKLRRANVVEGRLRYGMSKTSKGKSIKLLPQARSILEHYDVGGYGEAGFLFPILDRYDTSTPRKLHNAISARNVLTNKYLRKIARRAGIKTHLSFHIARHSFADIARQQGWDIYTISKALGHANIKVTETYLKGFDAEALDEKMEKLFG